VNDAGTAAAPAVTFDDLVTAATVGVTRKSLPIAELSGPAAGYAGVLDAGDPAAALLDAAALETVARRAGFQPSRGVPVPPAPDETAPAFSSRAARALREACGWDAGRGFAVDNALLPDLLSAAADAGYVAPPPLLPDLLDAAVRRTALRPVVAAVLGTRGWWLAAHRPDWRQVTESAAAPADDPGDPELWRTGMPAQRRAYLARLRERDPDAARDLLAAGWATETGGDRGQLIAILNRGLSLADAEFLETALDDRTSTVRTLARGMLTRLPDSAFGQRARARAEGVLHVEGHGPRRKLVAALPGEPDAAAIRDGFTARPTVPSIGAAAWQLTQVIAAAPLGDWTARLRLSPGQIVSLPVEGDLGADVHAGWRLAAVGQANPEWARALLAAGPGAGGGTSGSGSAGGRPVTGGNRPQAAWPPDQALAALLPRAARAERVAALLADMPLTTVNPPGWAGVSTPLTDEITGWPSPWPEVIAEAVLAVLVRAAGMANLSATARLVLTAAARNLPATGPRDYAAWLTRLADARPQTWTPAVRTAAATITLRRIFLTEIHRT
jgi:hypothetical protein